MKKNTILVGGAVLLIILGIYMIFLGSKAGILPPTITGVGFIVIAGVLVGIRDK